jgi:alanyl-tRNA synthetase
MDCSRTALNLARRFTLEQKTQYPDIRGMYVRFFKARGHSEVAPASLLPAGDDSTLFTGSGMQQLMPYLLGAPHPHGDRLVDVQPCVRAQDIDEVGDDTHTTFFEMLGNWSLAAYSKTQQIQWFMEFLVQVVGIDPRNLVVSCMRGAPTYGIEPDAESIEAWRECFERYNVKAEVIDVKESAKPLDVPAGINARIFLYDERENWWSRAHSVCETPEGDPCGPDSEVFFDFDRLQGRVNPNLAQHPANAPDRFMEIGNQVFMEYQKMEGAELQKLSRPCIDFGGGFERIEAAALGTSDIFMTSFLKPIIDSIQQYSNSPYSKSKYETRVVADHLRTAVFIAGAGVIPANKMQGYVLRRLLRRAYLHTFRMGLDVVTVGQICEGIIITYQEQYAYIAGVKDQIIGSIVTEGNKFERVLSDGKRRMLKDYAKGLDGSAIFDLSSTYGLPPDACLEIARANNVPVDPEWKSQMHNAKIAEQAI